MSKVLVTESHLEDIADAIRAKNGLETEYRPGDMAAAIAAIPSTFPRIPSPVLNPLSISAATGSKQISTSPGTAEQC